jgi:hypothetical protein
MKQTVKRVSTQLQTRTLFWLVFGLGALLRLVPLFYPMPVDDGLIRLRESIEWAYHPKWYGLGGQWPPLIMYLQGILIRLGADALWVAYSMGYLVNVASLVLVYRLSLALTGNAIAALWSLIACSIYWFHITLVNKNLIENFYTLLLLAFILVIVENLGKGRMRFSEIVSLLGLIALMMLTRHEARLVWVVSCAYLLWQRECQRFWVVAISGAITIAYLLGENLLLRGSFLADLESATRNFRTAAEITGVAPSIGERLFPLLRWYLPYHPSITLTGAIIWGMYKSFRCTRAFFVILICSASFALVLFSVFTSPLIPFLRYFVPIVVPAMTFAGVGLTAIPVRGAAPLLVIAAILVQSWHWYRANSSQVGHWQISHMLPVQRPRPSQEMLRELIANLPRNSRIYAMTDPHTPVDISQVAINTRRYDLVPILIPYKFYDQYLGELITNEPTPELLRQVNFVIVDRNYSESQRVIRTVYLLGGKVVYERNSLVVFQITNDNETGKSL